ncbi:prepilin peptidase [Virgibacillus salinus]|uniref:Type 4 prepilin peptidase 1 Aspartic peptidase. MEROPS family A24A n=1 Tax=Virgibacillus salinus TaxID=553311 RepID=A0A1H1AUR4_9BACI|nr:A24 family peptidase [Virgibacillus salinus]SDQ43427.1 type 4 prepilin peptidase 1 Aspartic peptidase. MEROPS family A24A [Virgibacillus salinus]
MDILLILFFFLLGLIFGSFFNVVGLRLPENIPFANDRSICPHCKHQLSWFENIPIISFVIQGAKCRHCKKEISFIYPVIELFTGILFALSYSLLGLNLEIITAILLISMLMIILVSDITYMLIPNRVLLFFLPLFIIIRIIQPLNPWWSSILGVIIGITILALIIIISRGGMGAGDMKLFGILGIILGVDKVLLAFFLSCMIGAIIGMMLLLFRVIERNQPVPFGPYIVAATLITYFYGELLLNWYFNLFL